ncbi:MAG: anaerobic dehydrogenase, typically selenocysteine-containing [Firmicutes bacterium]|nr:anaerobic dehydrogenase, typically selenocysteine-containing [Bacillota bacterium]
MEKNSSFFDVSRRSFLKLSAGTAFAAATGSWIPKLVSAEEAAKMPNVVWKKSVCSLCSGGCGLKVAVSEDKIIGVYGDEKNPFNKGGLCPKPVEMIQMVYSPNRVLSPMKKMADGSFQKISWDEATQLIAENHKKNNGKILGFDPKPGGHASGNAWQLFIDTNGIPSFGTDPICKQTEKVVRTAQLGSADQPNPAHDLAKAKLVIFVGANIAEIKAGQANWIMECRKNGGKVITIDTRLTKTARISDQFIMINPGTDGYLGYALINYIIKNNLYDKDFVEGYTSGFDKLAEEVAQFSLEEAEKVTGISKAVIEQLAKDIATLKPGMFWSGRGIIMTTNGASATYAFESLMYLMGNIGKAGAGVVAHLQSYGKPEGFYPKELKVSPKKIKHQDVISAFEKGDLKMIYSMGNPIVTWPNSAKMKEQFEKAFLVSYTLVMDDTASLADVILPVTHWYEEASAVKGINRTIQWREQVVKPLGEAKSGYEVWAMIAKALGQNEVLPFYPKNPEQCWEEIDRKFNKSNCGGISIERMLNTPGGVYWPCPDEKDPKPRKYSKLEFKTADKKINFYIKDWKEPIPKFIPTDKSPGNTPEAAKDFPLYLNTSKVAAHYHTQNAHFSWATEVEQPYLEIHPKTADAAGIKNGDKVTVETKLGKLTLTAKVTLGIHEKVVNTQPYFGVHSLYKLEPVNNLFPNVIDPIGQSFPQKNIQCRISKA